MIAQPSEDFNIQYIYNIYTVYRGFQYLNIHFEYTLGRMTFGEALRIARKLNENN